MSINNSLKSLVTAPWTTWMVYTLMTALLYMQASRFPFSNPLVIQPSNIDQQLPFVPSLAYTYITYFLLFPVLVLMAGKRKGFGTVYATGLACGLINVAIYILFPTMIAERATAPELTLLSVIQDQDTTMCAFPSGHVALPVSLALAAYIVKKNTQSALSRFWGKVAYAYAIWAVVIGISALLVGQHYIVDIYGGAVLGGLVAYGVNVLLNVYWRTFTVLVTEWLLIITVVALALYTDVIALYIIAGLVIATRQHALLMLFHDGVHGLVAGNRRINDMVINAFVGVPLLIPVHVYRAIHISHHKHVGTLKDPERLLLYWGQPWNYKPLKSASLLLQFLGDVSGFNSLVMMIRYMMMKRSDDSEIDLPATRFNPDLLLIFAVFVCGIVISLNLWPHATVVIFLLWYLPYLTLTQMLQKVRSFAEHSLDKHESYTFNWRPGLFGRLTIWPYNINYHREHHAHPNVPWDQLPSFADIGSVRPGRELITHIWTGSSKWT